jgi:predicted TIM-barrel fold metal-dependent hydrolase
MKLDHTTRRQFIKGSGMTIAAAGLALGIPNLGIAAAREPVIDIHQHTDYHGRSHAQMLTHQRAMGIAHTILLPSGRPVTSASTHDGKSNGLQASATGNEVCYALAQEYPGEYFFGANEVSDLPDAIAEIEKYLKLGAKVIGESKFGVECDSAEMQKIYELAGAYDVPVLMHWQHNMYNYGFDRFHNMLKKYPRVNFIGHAQTWWANIDKGHEDQAILYPKTKVTRGGITDRLLSDFPNMYGDLSAGSGLNSLLRDEQHASAFLKRHQDKLLYGSDCADAVGQGEECDGAKIIAAIKRLSPSKKIERKILYRNAKKLFRL